MRKNSTRLLSIAFVILSIMMGATHFSGTATAATPPNVGVWSNDCVSFNITLACGTLAVDSMINVQVNVTGATVGSVNGFEFYLYYDPAFLTATDANFNGVTIFANPNLVKSELAIAGTVHVAGVCLACSNSGTNGALITIVFKILAIGVSPVTLAVGLDPSGGKRSFTQLTWQIASGKVVTIVPTTSDGYFMNQNIKRGPVAIFTFSPSFPQQGQKITFDASASYDLDAPGAINKGIVKYMWDFGGGYATPTNDPVYVLSGGLVGNFSVRLTVVDTDDNFQGMQTHLLATSRNPFHDLVAQNITPSPNKVNPGDKITVNVIVVNNGTFTENYNLTVSRSPSFTIFGRATNQTIDIGASSPSSYTMDTTGLSPGFYTLAANVTILRSGHNPLGAENITRNDVAITTIQILGESSSSSLLLIVGGAVAGVAALAVIGLLLRRRRLASVPR